MRKEKKGKTEFVKVQLEVNLKECWVMWSCWLLLGIVTCGCFTSNICLSVHLFFPPWPQASQFTWKLGSYQYWTAWCGAADGVSRQCFMTETNEDVPSHKGCRQWWLHAVTEKKGFWSRKGDEQELSSVFFPSQRVAEWRSYNTEILVSSSNFYLNTVIK